MRIKRWINKGTPKTIVAILALFWITMSWFDFRGYSVEEMGVNSEVVLQYYDREIRLLEASDRANPYQKWIYSGFDPDKWLIDSKKLVAEKYLEDTGDEGQRLLDCIDYRLTKQSDSENFSHDPEYLAEVNDWLINSDETPRCWHFEMYLALTEDSEISQLYHSQNDRLMLRITIVSLVYDSLLVLGLIAIIICFIRRNKEVPLAPRIAHSWAPSTLLAVFFAANLLLYPWFYVVDAIYTVQEFLYGSWLAYPLYELLWRSFPAFCLTILFLKWPRNAWKTFELGKPVHIPLLIAALGIVLIADYALLYFSPETEVDTTDFMDYPYVDTIYMFHVLFTSVVLAPVFEEIVFRGFLFQGLRGKVGTLWAGVISTVLFALVHTQYDFWGWISVGITGAVAAFLVWRTGSITTSIALHALTNLLITWHVYLQYQSPL
ncbi:MAG: CPBP family intramembrane glutamic endopeptidase [Luteolibacter sp.]